MIVWFELFHSASSSNLSLNASLRVPQFKSSEQEGRGGVKRHRLCKRQSAKLFDFRRAADHGRQSESCCDTCGRGLRRGVIAAPASLCWSDAADPPQLHQFIMKQWAGGAERREKNAVRAEPATPESSQLLLHCSTATVCSSEVSATLFDAIREADDSGGRLKRPGNYLCCFFILFFFIKNILAHTFLHIPGRNSPIYCKIQFNPIYAKPLFLFLLLKTRRTKWFIGQRKQHWIKEQPQWVSLTDSTTPCYSETHVYPSARWIHTLRKNTRGPNLLTSLRNVHDDKQEWAKPRRYCGKREDSMFCWSRDNIAALSF